MPARRQGDAAAPVESAVVAGEVAVRILVLGPGCTKCEVLARHAEEAVASLGLDATVEKVTDVRAIAGFGVMTTPALVVDGTVRSVGRVPSAHEIERLLRP